MRSRAPDSRCAIVVLVARLTIPVLVASLALPAATFAYRELRTCPDLEPLEPPQIATSRARRCSRVVAKASRRYVRDALEAHAACFDRVQRSELAGNASALCRGLVRLSTGEFDLPSDAATAATLAEAEADLRTTVMATCSDTDAAGVGSCASTASGLAACVLAEQRDHVLDLLDQTHGEIVPVLDPAARTCQQTIAAASRRYVVRVARAHERCLKRHVDGRAGVHLAEHCLGAVRSGADEPDTAC